MLTFFDLYIKTSHAIHGRYKHPRHRVSIRAVQRPPHHGRGQGGQRQRARLVRDTLLPRTQRPRRQVLPEHSYPCTEQLLPEQQCNVAYWIPQHWSKA